MSVARVCLACTLLVFSAAGAAAAESYAVIGHPKSATASLSRDQLKALFTGKAKLLAGSPAQLVVRPAQDSAFAAFADQVFGTSAKTLLSKISQEVFKGEIPKPRRATTDVGVVQQVADAVGSIGVIDAHAAANLPPGVVVLAIGR